MCRREKISEDINDLKYLHQKTFPITATFPESHSFKVTSKTEKKQTLKISFNTITYISIFNENDNHYDDNIF